MWYFGGSYPALYFPSASGLAYAPPERVELELPMVMAVSDIAAPAIIATLAELPMRAAPRSTLAPRRVSERTTQLLRVVSRLVLARSPIGAEIPSRVWTRDELAPMRIGRRALVPMHVARTVVIPMRIAEPVDLPMRDKTRVLLEHTYGR